MNQLVLVVRSGAVSVRYKLDFLTKQLKQVHFQSYTTGIKPKQVNLVLRRHSVPLRIISVLLIGSVIAYLCVSVCVRAFNKCMARNREPNQLV